MRTVLRAAILPLLLLAAACAQQQTSQPAATAPAPQTSQPAAAPKPVSQPDIYLIYFAFDSTDISPIGQGIVMQVVNEAKARPPTRVTVNGYADRVGPAGYNQQLSEERADAVVKALVKAGLTSVNIRTLGMGEEQSIDAPIGGRHVEIKLFRE